MDQIQTLSSQPCQKHPDNKLLFLYMANEDRNRLICDQCFIENQNLRNTLSLATIKACKDDYIFTNWPPLNDSSMLHELSKISKIQEANLLEQINSIFDEIKQEVVISLEVKKKIALQQVQDSIFSNQSLINQYNKISGKQFLRDLVSSFCDNQQQFNERINNFIREKYQQQNSNSKILASYLKQYQNYQNQFQLSNYTEFKDNLIKSISDFQILPNLKERKEPERQQKKEPSLQQSSLYKSILDFSQSQQIEEIKTDLDQILYSLLIEDNRDNLYTYSTQDSKNMYNQPQDKQASDVQSINDLINLKEKETPQDDLVIDSRFFGTSVLKDINIQDSITITEDEDGQLIQIKKEQNVFGCAYFKYDLTHSQKYVFRFKFDHHPKDYLIIGLYEKENIETDYLSCNHLGKAFGKNYQDYCTQIIKGQDMWDLDDNQIIEMRVDISNQLIQFLDYPEYKNINQINSEFIINQQHTYYFGVEIGDVDKFTTTIDILCFKELDSFV